MVEVVGIIVKLGILESVRMVVIAGIVQSVQVVWIVGISWVVGLFEMLVTFGIAGMADEPATDRHGDTRV